MDCFMGKWKTTTNYLLLTNGKNADFRLFIPVRTGGENMALKKQCFFKAGDYLFI